MRRYLTLTIVGAVAVVYGARPAQAQNAAQAEKLFTDAKQHMAAGKLAAACDEFAASQRLDASVATLMNLADCREKNNQLASAWEAFVAVEHQTRGDGKYADMSALAARRAAALEPRLSYLTINVPDEVRVDGLEVTRDGAVIEPGAWNRSLPVDGGAHTVAGRAPGHEAWSTTVTVAAERDHQAVEVPKFKAIRDLGHTIVIERAAPGLFTTRRKIAVAVGGGAVAAAVVGGVLGLRATSQQDDADRTCASGVNCTADQAVAATDLNRRARRSALYANVGFGVAVAAATTAAVLWITGKPRGAAEPPAAALAPALAPGYAGLAATGRF